MRLVLLATFLLGVTLVVSGRGFEASTAPAPGGPVLVAVSQTFDETIWAPAPKTFQLETMPAVRRGSSVDAGLGETYVRPAWGMLIVAVWVFLYLLAQANSEATVIPVW